MTDDLGARAEALRLAQEAGFRVHDSHAGWDWLASDKGLARLIALARKSHLDALGKRGRHDEVAPECSFFCELAERAQCEAERAVQPTAVEYVGNCDCGRQVRLIAPAVPLTLFTEADARDAARYRWLRPGLFADSVSWARIQTTCHVHNPHCVHLEGDALDKAMDTSMADDVDDALAEQEKKLRRQLTIGDVALLHRFEGLVRAEYSTEALAKRGLRLVGAEPVAWLAPADPDDPDYYWPNMFVANDAHPHIKDLAGAFPVYAAAKDDAIDEPNKEAK